MNAYRVMAEALHRLPTSIEYECFVYMQGGTAWSWGPFCAVDLRWGGELFRMYGIFGWVLLRPSSPRQGAEPEKGNGT